MKIVISIVSNSEVDKMWSKVHNINMTADQNRLLEFLHLRPSGGLILANVEDGQTCEQAYLKWLSILNG